MTVVPTASKRPAFFASRESSGSMRENPFDVVVSADPEYDVEVSLVGHTRYDEVLVGLVDGGCVLTHVGSEHSAAARERALEVLHDLIARSRAQDEDVGSVTHRLLSPLRSRGT